MSDQLAINYARRIKAGVQRLGTPVSLTRADPPETVSIAPMVLPSIVQIVASDSSAAVLQQSAQQLSVVAAGGDPSASSTASTPSSATDALPTLTLLQDSSQAAPQSGDTFTFDSVEWTIQSVAFEYAQGTRIAIISTATAAAIG